MFNRNILSHWDILLAVETLCTIGRHGVTFPNTQAHHNHASHGPQLTMERKAMQRQCLAKTKDMLR